MTIAATALCTGPGTRWATNATSRTRIPCTCGKFHAPLPAAERASAVARAVLSKHVQHQDPAPGGSEGAGMGTPMSDAEVQALESERSALIASLPGLDFSARTKANLRLDEVERLLRHDRKVRETMGRDEERVIERTGAASSYVRPKALAPARTLVVAAGQPHATEVTFLSPKPYEPPAQPLTPEEKFQQSRPGGKPVPWRSEK